MNNPFKKKEKPAKRQKLTKEEKRELKEEKKRVKEEQKERLLAQHLIPLKTIEGVFAMRTDGKYVGYVHIDGINDSLSTDAQRLSIAVRLASALRSVTHPISILKYPKRIDSTAQLTHIDKTIASLEEEVAQAGITNPKDPRNVRLEILKKWLRPDAEREAFSGSRITHPTYIAFEFEKKYSTRSALTELNAFVDELKRSGFGARVVEKSEIIELCQVFFTPYNVNPKAIYGKQPVVVEGQKELDLSSFGKATNARAKSKPTMSAQDAFLINAMTPQIKENHSSLEVDADVCAVFYINDYPTENGLGWANVLFEKPNYYISIKLEPQSTLAVRRAINTHDKQVNEGFTSRWNTASDVDRLEREQRHGFEVLSRLGDDNEKMFQMCITGVLHAPTYEKLAEEITTLSTTLTGNNMEHLIINNNQLNGFLSASPLCTVDRSGFEQTSRPVPAITVGYSLFAHKRGVNDPLGIDFGTDGSGGKIRLNTSITNNEGRNNRNAVVLADSGSGKTYFIKRFSLREFVLFGTMQIFFDVDNDYVKLTNELGGVNASPFEISPFEPRAVTYDPNDDDEYEEEFDEESAKEDYVLASTIPYVETALRIAFDIPIELNPFLEIALENAYGEYGYTFTTTFRDYLENKMSYPVMRDIYASILALKDSDEEHKVQYDELALLLRGAAEGLYSERWNTRTIFSGKPPVLNFKFFEAFPDEAQRAAEMFNCISWAWSQVRLARFSGAGVRIHFDEGHEIVNERMLVPASMVRSIAKRIRKHGTSGLTFITQEVNDVLEPQVKRFGASILNNATYKFFGHCDGQNLRALSLNYSLPEDLQNMLLEATRGHFIMYAGSAEKSWLEIQKLEWEENLFGKASGF